MRNCADQGRSPGILVEKRARWGQEGRSPDMLKNVSGLRPSIFVNKP